MDPAMSANSCQMISILSSSAARVQPEGKRSRDGYSRVICLGCRERRIRCELPKDVEIPKPGEVREAQEPCYRCKRLGYRCVIRRTILGRPSARDSVTAPARLQRATAGDLKRGTWICTSTTTASQLEAPLLPDLQYQRTESGALDDLSLDGDLRHWNKGRLLSYKPQSSETIIIINAIDTIRQENVEGEWFRHLPAYYGQKPALDLAIQAQVQTCALARGVTRMSSRDCYQALSLAFSALKSSIEDSREQSNDFVLAATALLAVFEGTIKRDGVPTRLHINGLAAIIAARPATHTVTQLARDILDWYAAETSVMACIHGTPSPFETIPRAYFTSDGLSCADSDRAQLKGLGNELFIRIPRLVMLMRMLKNQSSPYHALLLRAQKLLHTLLDLKDPQVENRIMQSVATQPSDSSDDIQTHGQNLCFASIKDFEALTCYWQGRLSLLRLERHLQKLLACRAVLMEGTGALPFSLSLSFGPQTNEMCLLAKYITMSVEFASALPLFKQKHLLAYAMIVVWGATIDTSVKQETERTSPLYELLLRKVNRALNAKPELVAEDMDEAADVFIGGERRGMLAVFYGL